ncbi:MAG TPA: hypothetical protein VFU88_19555 [Ktedonobacterales bacterium]|nr:hypothetical protein [Ktedonobacterales bacterium]
MQSPPPPGEMPPTPSPGETPPTLPSTPPPRQPQYPYQYPYPGPYPYPYPYPYGPAPQPPKRSNTALWVTLSILAGVIVLSCVGCGVALVFVARSVPTETFVSALGPQITATQFCTAEETGDYVGAYELFSTTLRDQWTQDQWTAANQAREQHNGAVRDCQVVPTGGSTTSDTTTVQVQVTLDDGEHTGSLTLVNDSGLWEIDAIDPGLGLT